MNERVMQFRIGIFVIVAALVLGMLLVWFGEGPSLFREQGYVTIKYAEAPGVGEGIPVRKSGIRVGEVAAIRFEDRPGEVDGVLVTLALETKYRIKAGSVPRITRGLIGDVAIDLQPGTGDALMPLAADPAAAPVLEIGEVAPDPMKAIQAASETFDHAQDALASISKASNKIAVVAENAAGIKDLMATWDATGQNVKGLSARLDRVVAANEGSIQPAIEDVREVARKLNTMLDPATQARFRQSIADIDDASRQLAGALADVRPLMKDLGAESGTTPRTNAGWAMFRLNRVAYQIGLLTRQLEGEGGRLNTNGTLQRLLTDDGIHAAALDVLNHARSAMRSLSTFAQQLAKNPSLLSEGVLRGR